MKNYIVFDGRANFDVDCASVLECIGEATEEDAVKEFKRSWSDYDACLFAYDSDGDTLVNGEQVFT